VALDEASSPDLWSRSSLLQVGLHCAKVVNGHITVLYICGSLESLNKSLDLNTLHERYYDPRPFIENIFSV